MENKTNIKNCFDLSSFCNEMNYFGPKSTIKTKSNGTVGLVLESKEFNMGSSNCKNICWLNTKASANYDAISAKKALLKGELLIYEVSNEKGESHYSLGKAPSDTANKANFSLE
jgi:hypothetical protein